MFLLIYNMSHTSCFHPTSQSFRAWAKEHPPLLGHSGLGLDATRVLLPQAGWEVALRDTCGLLFFAANGYLP